VRAAQVLALEKETEGAQLSRRFLAGLPPALYAAMIVCVIVLVGAAGAPVFTIAGAIK
jgi:hypothetical protein